MFTARRSSRIIAGFDESTGSVYNARDDSSALVILDATNFGGEPVATVALPQRVPFGFHGIWEPAPK